MLSHRQTVAGLQTVDLALDGEDLVDAPDRLARQRRLPEIGQFEEMAPPMAPARGFRNRPGLALAIIEVAEPGPRVRPSAGPRTGSGVGLEDPGIPGQMPGRVLAAAIARVEEHRRRGPSAHGLDPSGVRSGEWPVVTHIGP
jgi:hypothetical protein